MSEAPNEVVTNSDFAPQGVSEFKALMDIMAPEAGSAPAGEGGAAADAAPAAGAAAGAADGQAGAAGVAVDPAGDGAAAAPAQPGADGAAAAPAQPADGAAGEGQPAAEVQPGAGAAAVPGGTGGDVQPAGDGGADANGGAAAAGHAPAAPDTANLINQLGEISTKYEERVAGEHQAKALEEVRGEHPRYFEALEKHPRLLVGQKVPSLTGQGDETLTSAEDAAQWQEALKSILVQEVMDRAGRTMEADAATLNTVHASIELFQNNADLIPNSKGFDKELADRFAGLVKPYEMRVDGKLYGWTIPVQQLINQVRTQLVSERAAKATAAPETPAPAAAAAAPAAGAPASTPSAPAAPADGPQAGIQSKAGNSSETEDFSTLWGTLNLPNLRL